MPLRSPALAGKVSALCPDSRIPVDFRETCVTRGSETGVNDQIRLALRCEHLTPLGLFIQSDSHTDRIASALNAYKHDQHPELQQGCDWRVAWVNELVGIRKPPGESMQRH